MPVAGRAAYRGRPHPGDRRGAAAARARHRQQHRQRRDRHWQSAEHDRRRLRRHRLLGFRDSPGAGRAGRRAVARHHDHFPAEDLFRHSMDGIHDLHGAGRRPRHLRRTDPRRRNFFPYRIFLWRDRGLVFDRPRRGGGCIRTISAPRFVGYRLRMLGSDADARPPPD